MNDNRFTATAAQFVEAFGSNAHGAIDTCIAGGERLGEFAAERWDRAFEEASPRLSAETRRNAANARKVFARYYRRGLERSGEGAARAVDAMVKAAGGAIERAEAFRAARAGA
jgi:hypothetical protein